MNENKINKGSAIIKLVVWSIVAVVLITVFTVVMAGRSFSDFNGVINVGGLGGEYYANADSYNVGNQEYSESFSDIDLSWTSGSVTFELWDEDYVALEETGAGNDTDHFMRSKIENGKLIIKYVKSGLGVLNTYPQKTLKVLLPKSIAMSLDDVDIDTASANVTFLGLYLANMYDSNLKNGFKIDTLDFDSASGDLDIDGVVANELDADTASGKMKIGGVFEKVDIDSASGDVEVFGDHKELNVDCVSGRAEIHRYALEGYYSTNVCTVSGDVYIHANALSHLDVETVSGNVYVDMKDYGDGFVAVLDTVSGSMTCNGSRGDRYTLGDGAAKFDFETVSGNVTINLR